MNLQSERWCFTVNNPGEWRPDWESLRDDWEAAYMIYQLERGAQGTPHLQGYIRFRSRRKGTEVKRAFDRNDMHIERAQGNEKQNHDYCSKSDTREPGEEPHEFGDYDEGAGTQGRRNDKISELETFTRMVAANATEREIALAVPGLYLRHASNMQAYRVVVTEQPVARDVLVEAYSGPTGVGKSHRVRHLDPDVFIVQAGRDPWGLYRGQRLICFEEFNYEKWPIEMMNMYLDKWRCPLDRRYRDCFAEWTHVIICSNATPGSWYPNAHQSLIDAFRRRFTNLYWITSREQDLAEAITHW